jgi:hypothetical protein
VYAINKTAAAKKPDEGGVNIIYLPTTSINGLN